jgi:hypothetical protein
MHGLTGSTISVFPMPDMKNDYAVLGVVDREDDPEVPDSVAKKPLENALERFP